MVVDRPITNNHEYITSNTPSSPRPAQLNDCPCIYIHAHEREVRGFQNKYRPLVQVSSSLFFFIIVVGSETKESPLGPLAPPQSPPPVHRRRNEQSRPHHTAEKKRVPCTYWYMSMPYPEPVHYTETALRSTATKQSATTSSSWLSISTMQCNTEKKKKKRKQPRRQAIPLG